MSTTGSTEYVWVWDDLDKGTGFYGAVVSKSNETVRVRVVTRCLTGNYTVGSIVSIPAERVHFG